MGGSDWKWFSEIQKCQVHVDSRFIGIWMLSGKEELQAYVKYDGLYVGSLPMFIGMYELLDAAGNSSRMKVLAYVAGGSGSVR